LWMCWWVAFVVTWLLLVGTLERNEILAGVGAGAVAATVAELVRVQDYRRFRPRAKWLFRAARLPAHVFADSLLVFRVLYRRLFTADRRGGAFRACRLDPGGDDAQSAARRALIVASLSLAPNTYVVGIDEEEGLILVHQLVPSRHERARADILGRL
jgi:multisubunit Na+/H+ antiporter MnhE subunit